MRLSRLHWLIVAALFVQPEPSPAQDRGIGVVPTEGRIEILEPTEWKGIEPRGIGIKQRKSLRIIGRAMHSTGVNGVLINGDRAALQVDGGGAVRFTGYVPVAANTKDVEIAAFTNDGRTFVRRYSVEPTAAEKTYATPTEAWAPSNGFRGKRWAVVVGLSEYHDRGITPLKYADRDARAFYDFLISGRAGAGGFPKENVVLLLNREATAQNLRTALVSFLKEATEDDQVVIYFAGHGAPDPERLSDLYLLTYDTRVNNISGTAYPMDDMASATRRILARDIVVITDACHSAGVGGQVSRRNVGANQINQAFLEQLNASAGGLTIFTASQATQASHEGPQWGSGHGVFTHYMLEALRGAADEDRDQIVTLVEMMEYTREKVRRETRNAQIPTISQTAYDGSLPLSIVTDTAVYAATQPETKVALPSMFAVPENTRAHTVTYSPGGAFLRGLTLPGMGMFYVDRPGLGLVYAVGTVAGPIAGSFGVGVLDEEVPGYAWIAAVWTIGAFHARGIAKSKNAEATVLGKISLGPVGDVNVASPNISAGPDGVRMELVRLRF